MSKIYTRTGDKGSTSLFTGQRIPKYDPFIEALGTVDEANCALGLALSHLPQSPLLQSTRQQLEDIQHTLFDIGAAVATPRSCHEDRKLEKTRFNRETITALEQGIDAMEAELPSLHTFILPGGHPAGAALHQARAIVRRAERLVVPLYERQDVVETVLKYLNRLSDFLFVAARFVNHQLQIPETQWQPHR